MHISPLVALDDIVTEYHHQRIHLRPGDHVTDSDLARHLQTLGHQLIPRDELERQAEAVADQPVLPDPVIDEPLPFEEFDDDEPEPEPPAA